MSQRRFMPPPTRFGPPQGVVSPPRQVQPARPAAVQAYKHLTELLGAPGAVRGVLQCMTPKQRDGAKVILGKYWKLKFHAGSADPTIDLETTGVHGCGARLTYRVGKGRRIIETNYAGGNHAEMQAINELLRAGYQTDAIISIEIEKEPCTRCAAVLNCLNLGDNVTYKTARPSDKDHAGWIMPASWNFDYIMDVTTTLAASALGNLAVTSGDVQEFRSFFCGQRWW